MAYRRREGETAHQARERIAREKGFRSYRDYRKRSAQERQNATAALVRARGPRSSYARGARGADVTIRNRARQRVETTAGTVLTSRDPRRLRPAIAAASPDAMVSFRVVVRVEDVDRRRRDPRRRRGRDSGFRNLEWQTAAGMIDTSSPAALRRWLDAEIRRQMNRRYPGGYTVDTVTVVVPPAGRRRRAA